MGDMVIRSPRVLLTDGTVRPAEITVASGRISSVRLTIDDQLATLVPRSAVVFPGLIDAHVHVNDPGRTGWEGFATASAAAAAGGVTTIIDMPLNSIPATTNVKALAAKF